MENIFENAYFGKAYKTRNGRKALYQSGDSEYHHLFLSSCDIIVDEHGDINCREIPDGLDIVSEWTESIEEKELDELDELADFETFKQSEEFNDSIDDVLSLFDSCEQLRVLYKKSLIWAFKKGYRKAMEE